MRLVMSTLNAHLQAKLQAILLVPSPSARFRDSLRAGTPPSTASSMTDIRCLGLQNRNHALAVDLPSSSGRQHNKTGVETAPETETDDGQQGGAGEVSQMALRPSPLGACGSDEIPSIQALGRVSHHEAPTRHRAPQLSGAPALNTVALLEHAAGDSGASHSADFAKTTNELPTQNPSQAKACPLEHGTELEASGDIKESSPLATPASSARLLEPLSSARLLEAAAEAGKGAASVFIAHIVAIFFYEH